MSKDVNEILVQYMKEFFADGKNISELKTLLADSKSNNLNHYSLRLYLVSSQTSTKTANIKYRNVSLPDNKLTNGFLPVSLQSLEEIVKAGK
jgi:hypothetical protein